MIKYEAKKCLLEYFTRQIDRHRRCLETAKIYLNDAKGMKNPEEK